MKVYGGDPGERKLLEMFIRDLKKISLLTREEENVVVRRARKGDKAAINRLIEANLRFVIKVVFKYWYPGLPFMDLISHGCQGLMRAAEIFDPDRGVKFLSHAGDAIRNSIIKAIIEHKQHVHDSLDKPIHKEENYETSKDRLVSEAPQADEGIFYSQVRGWLDQLSERERRVIELRFWHGLSLAEIGLKFGITREGVRGIEAKALRKLRWGVRHLYPERIRQYKASELKEFRVRIFERNKL
ncbi:MAG: sigma-70 family RNA polymerase sigma factor [Thermodesulfobacteriota bacterium]